MSVANSNRRPPKWLHKIKTLIKCERRIFKRNKPTTREPPLSDQPPLSVQPLLIVQAPLSAQPPLTVHPPLSVQTPLHGQASLSDQPPSSYPNGPKPETEEVVRQFRPRTPFVALARAASDGNRRLVATLLEQGVCAVSDADERLAHGDEEFNGVAELSPLHIAVKANRRLISTMLLNDFIAYGREGRGGPATAADIEALMDLRDVDGKTLLSLASKTGDDDFVHRLLTELAPPLEAQDKQGRTALHHAADAGKSLIAELLLKHGADTEAVDKSGKTPLQMARTRKYHALAELLKHWEEVPKLPRGGTSSTAVTKHITSSVMKLEGHADLVTSVCFSADSSVLASCSMNATLRIWDSTSGKLRNRVMAGSSHLGEVLSVVASRQNALATASGYSITLRTIDGEDRCSVFGGKNGRVLSMAFSPKGFWLASGSEDGGVQIWDTAWARQKERLLHALTGHGGPVNSVAFSPKGPRLLSASSDRTVRIWDPVLGRLVTRLIAHTGKVMSVAASQNGRQFASGSDTGELRIWNMETAALEHIIQAHADVCSITSIAFSPNCSWLASASHKGGRAWDIATGKPREGFVLLNTTPWARTVAISPDGRRLAAGSIDRKTVWLCDLTEEAVPCREAKQGTPQSQTQHDAPKSTGLPSSWAPERPYRSTGAKTSRTSSGPWPDRVLIQRGQRRVLAPTDAAYWD